MLAMPQREQFLDARYRQRQLNRIGDFLRDFGQNVGLLGVLINGRDHTCDWSLAGSVAP